MDRAFPENLDYDRVKGDSLRRLCDYLKIKHQAYISQEVGSDCPSKVFTIPVALCLIIDEKNGGDPAAQDVAKRFHLLHNESGSIMDFYFLGWEWVTPADRADGIQFNLASFNACRNGLKKAGVKQFNGNADLILVDLSRNVGVKAKQVIFGEPELNFKRAIHIDLSKTLDGKTLPPVGKVLQQILSAAEKAAPAGWFASEGSAVSKISNILGLRGGVTGFIDFIIKKGGKVFGADTISCFATRNLGPKVSLKELSIKP